MPDYLIFQVIRLNLQWSKILLVIFVIVSVCGLCQCLFFMSYNRWLSDLWSCKSVTLLQLLPLSNILIISSFFGIVWIFLTITITQIFSNLLHSAMEIKLTATLLVAPNRQCDPLVACSATRMWDLAYRNLKYSAWRESLCWQRNIQIMQFKIMETVHIPEDTLANFQSLGS